MSKNQIIYSLNIIINCFRNINIPLWNSSARPTGRGGSKRCRKYEDERMHRFQNSLKSFWIMLIKQNLLCTCCKQQDIMQIPGESFLCFVSRMRVSKWRTFFWSTNLPRQSLEKFLVVLIKKRSTQNNGQKLRGNVCFIRNRNNISLNY